MKTLKVFGLFLLLSFMASVFGLLIDYGDGDQSFFASVMDVLMMTGIFFATITLFYLLIQLGFSLHKKLSALNKA